MEGEYIKLVMKESKFLGALLPSSPDFLPIIEAIREKYKLPEISPDDDPIKEIYLGDEIIPLEEFRREIENLIRADLAFMPPATAKQYLSAKALSQIQELKDIDKLPDEFQQGMTAFVALAKSMAEPFVQLLDAQIDSVVRMLYIYLLTGETEEAPSDWFGKVIITTASGEPVIMAIASEVTNLDAFIQQIRAEHKKLFGMRNHRITETAVSTAHYLRLKREKKPWDYIVEEYIRRSKIKKLPKNKNSARYLEIKRLCEQTLKKRMQRTEDILDVIIRDKK